MDQLKGLSLQGIMKAIKLKSLKNSMDWISIKIKWVKWTTYLMKVYLGKLCVSSNLIQCKSAIHVIYHIQKPARDHLLRLIVLLMNSIFGIIDHMIKTIENGSIIFIYVMVNL